MSFSDKENTFSTDMEPVYRMRFILMFKWLSPDEFMKEPTRVQSFMRDFGFEDREIWLLKSVMAQDPKDFRGFFECNSESEDQAIKAIADHCLVSRDALSDIMHAMKNALSADDGPEMIGEFNGEKCLVSNDGVAKYSLDMKILLNVAKVESFQIPDSVTSIGDFAFSGCSSLEEIVIPDSVTSIGVEAFSCCSSLEEIVIPDSVTSIGDNAFCCCSSLKKVIIPDSVTSIGWDIFSGDNQVHVTISPYNERFQSVDGCLYSNDGCELHVGYALVKDGMCRIPNSVTTIGDNAFSGCSSLEEIVIPDSVTSIGDSAFDGCSSLEEIVIPDSVRSIGNGAFSWCTSLKKVIIPDSMTSIGDSAFDGCSSIGVIEVPHNLKYKFCGIGTEAKIIRR